MVPEPERRTLFIDGQEVSFARERNLLEVCRKAHIDIPTFCYHSHLSVYGACRLCLVEIEDLGIVTSCTTLPRPGMRVRTHTPEIQEMRRVAIELLLSNHDRDCPTCPKNATCKLQELSQRLGIRKIRFRSSSPQIPLDTSSPSLVRNPNRCILCGDCVRVCSEVQSVGAIDFAFRGSRTQVLPAFGRPLNETECVHCGQCAAVCPTGAIVPKYELEPVWEALADSTRYVVAQIAPAVRVAVAEAFGFAPGTVATGQIAAALRRIGFARVYDTSFAADLTVIEEATELLQRKTTAGNLPMFTSCCPAWVKFAEQYFPDLLSHLSTCRSPQQMFGSLAKNVLPEMLGIDRSRIFVVSVMPCTAKKYEAKRPEFSVDGSPEVDAVLTTQELIAMIRAHGLDFSQLRPESFDLPFGQKSGAGVIFGTTGGVAEAVLRYLVAQQNAAEIPLIEFQEVRGTEGIREARVQWQDETLRVAIVHGLAHARALAEKVRRGESSYDLVEVMACPLGCVGGGGQPVVKRMSSITKRMRALYEIDRCVDIHCSHQNPAVTELYRSQLGEPASPRAHRWLHTRYVSRRRNLAPALVLLPADSHKIRVSVCVGTSCYLAGNQELLQRLAETVRQQGWQDRVALEGAFCFENCRCAPTVAVGRTLLSPSSYESVVAEIERQLALQPSTDGHDP